MACLPEVPVVDRHGFRQAEDGGGLVGKTREGFRRQVLRVDDGALLDCGVEDCLVADGVDGAGQAVSPFEHVSFCVIGEQRFLAFDAGQGMVDVGAGLLQGQRSDPGGEADALAHREEV